MAIYFLNKDTMNFQIITLIIAIFVFNSPVWALTGFTSMPNCGSARIVSGDSCKNLAIEIDFTGCEKKSSPQLAQKIICKDLNLKARFQDDLYRYEAQFAKANNSGWGSAVSWNSVGSVNQWKKVPVPAPASVPVPASVAISISTDNTANVVVAAPIASRPASADSTVLTPAVSPFKFSGFVDMRYTSFSSKDNLTVANAHAESGFGIEDGALYFNYEKSKVAVIVDVAFRRGKDSDTNPSTIPNQSSNSNLAIGVDKTQLYLKYNLHENLYVNFGQFDAIFGVELNDSKDRFFGKTGLVYDSMLPVTHTGAMLEYSANGLTAKIFAANPSNKGSNGTSTAGDEKCEYGAAINYSKNSFRTQLGYMTRPILKANGGSLAGRNLIDFTAGVTVEKFSLDFEYAIVDDPNKNTLTTADNNDREKVGTGLLVLTSYELSDSFLLGVRYEHLQDDPAATSNRTTDSYGLSVHYKLSPELDLRSEYVGYSFKNLSDVVWTDSRLNLAVLLKF